MRIPVCFIMLLCLAGCMQNIKPTVKNFNTSTPGVVQSRMVGEALFEKGTVNIVPGFLVTRDSNLPMMEHLLFPPVKRGNILVCTGMLRSGDYVCTDPALKLENIQTDSGKSLPDSLPQFIIGRSGHLRGLYFSASGYSAIHQGEPLADFLVPTDASLSGSFKQELIYNGKNDDVIKLIYREFAEDSTKPSLFQGYSFNIASLDIIRVQDVIIEIIEATETSIRFVIKN